MSKLMQQKKIILASQSPQRIQILKNAGFDFATMTSNYPEVFRSIAPEELAKLHALGKVIDVVSRSEDTNNKVFVGCDTIVFCNGEILEKPEDVEDAARMLKLQSEVGISTVVSGLAVLDAQTGQEYVTEVITKVYLQKLTNLELDWYLSTKEWEGKSGGFAIQGLGSRFFTGVEGDILNVVGLPLNKLYQILLDWRVIA